MKFKYFITFLFTSLILINLVNNAFPHHHHNDDMLTHEGCENQGCDIADIGTGEPCMHCHAFNGMQYFPVTKNTKVISLKHSGSVFIIQPSAGPLMDPGKLQRMAAAGDPPGQCMGLYRNITSLRAPPPYC